MTLKIALVADTDALDHFQLHRLHLSDISLHHTVYMAYLKGHYQIPCVKNFVSVASMLFQNSVQQVPPSSRLPRSHAQSPVAALPVQTSDPQPGEVRCSEYRRSADIQPPASNPLHFHRRTDAPSV